MSDEFAVIGRDDDGHPQVRYCLDPREVTTIRDPERDDEIIGYLWEPVGPVPSPIRADPWANPRLIERAHRRPRRRWLRWRQREAGVGAGVVDLQEPPDIAVRGDVE